MMSNTPSVASDRWQARRAQVERDLENEFGDRIPFEIIRSYVHEAVDDLAEASIKDFVHVLAWRRVRARLHAGLVHRST